MVTARELYHDDDGTQSARFLELAESFRTVYKREPTHWFSSPGRAEIVGNHTDHQAGKVLVSAISCDMIAAVGLRDDDTVVLASEGYQPIRISVRDTAMREREKGKSIALVRGVLQYLKTCGYRFGGFSAVTQSDIFRGAGVSSSAAFEILIAEIVNCLYLGGTLTAVKKAEAGMYAENRYYGKPCGLLDQCGIALGGLNLIDFSGREPQITAVPPLQGYRAVITDTGSSHAALTAHYDDIRREMCEIAACFGKNVLGEVEKSDFFERIPALRTAVSDRAVLRSIHFFEECERADRAAQALENGDVCSFLEQVRLSGESSLKYLQNCYVAGERSQPVTLALYLSEHYLKDGAYRMMGGGFAGSVLAFCPESEAQAYYGAMARVFGADHVYFTNFRLFGTTQLKLD